MIYMSMDNWSWKNLMKVICWILGMDMSHPFHLFISTPPLWIFEPWEHADALLSDILLIQPNSINFKKRIFNCSRACGRWMGEKSLLEAIYSLRKSVPTLEFFRKLQRVKKKTKLENPHLTVIRENASCSVFCLVNKSNYVVWDLPVGSPEADFLLLSKFPAFLCSWNSVCQ